MARRRYDYNDFSYYKSTRTIEVSDGIKARSKRGDFAKNWWARLWIQSLERLMDSGRLTRGRSYARKGQVLSIEEKSSGIVARVQGSQRKPYSVTIQMAALSDAQWAKVFDALSEQALFTAELLAGEMPHDIETAFETAGVSLFPARRGDLETDCSCPDYANPCKHIAAVFYILGERFDEDPFLLFRLRGRSQEQVLQALRSRRAGQMEIIAEDKEDVEEIIPLEDCMDAFWEMGAPLDEVSILIQPPSIEMPLLKRAGEASFVPSPGIEDLLRPAYRLGSQAALDAAFVEQEDEKYSP
jgi:uncharacterized Zn finger protein